jgi:DNA-directed RNA polymerase omega subunit
MSADTKAPASQFAYVVLAARRARQLMAGAPPLTDNLRTQKATHIAIDELDQSLLEYELPERATGEEDKEGKRKKG